MASFLKKLVSKGPPSQPKNPSAAPPKEAKKKEEEDVFVGKPDEREVKDTTKVEESTALERFHDCCGRGDLDSVKDLVSGKKVKVDEKGNLSFVALHWAGRGGHKDVVDFLLSNKADPNPVNDSGDTPLHLAASKSHNAVILAIVKAGGNPSLTNKAGQTAMDLASNEDTREALRGRDPSAGPAIVTVADSDDDDDSD